MKFFITRAFRAPQSRRSIINGHPESWISLRIGLGNKPEKNRNNWNPSGFYLVRYTPVYNII